MSAATIWPGPPRIASASTRAGNARRTRATSSSSTRATRPDARSSAAAAICCAIHSASRARSSADSADSVRRASLRICAPWNSPARALRLDERRERALRVPQFEAHRIGGRRFAHSGCARIHEIHSVHIDPFCCPMRAQGFWLHGLAGSKGWASMAGHFCRNTRGMRKRRANALAHAARVRGGCPGRRGESLNRAAAARH